MKAQTLDLSRNIFPGAPLNGFTRKELIDALSRVQHFLPPRPTRQDKAVLIEAAQEGLASEVYRVQMADALREVRLRTDSGGG